VTPLPACPAISAALRKRKLKSEHDALGDRRRSDGGNSQAFITYQRVVAAFFVNKTDIYCVDGTHPRSGTSTNSA
jgi:hypothetical protein